MCRVRVLPALVGGIAIVLVACSGGASLPGPAQPAAAPAPASAASASAPATQPAPTTAQVRAGLLPSILSAPLFAGADMGIYRQNGLEIAIEPFTVTSDIMTLIAGGRLEFGQITMGAAALNAFYRGMDLTMTAAGSIGSLQLVIRKDLWDSGAIRSTRDLKGTRFALNGRGVLTEYIMYKILEKGGLTPEDVEVVILPWPDQITALGNGAIDVALVGEPFGALAVLRGVGVILEEKQPGQSDPWYAPGLQGGMIVMNRQWAEANPALATAVIKSYLQTARRIQGAKIYEEPEALASIERWVNISPEVVKAGAPPLWVLNGRIDAEQLLDIQRSFIRTGAADYREPIPIERLYNPRYLEAALREIGVVPEN